MDTGNERMISPSMTVDGKEFAISERTLDGRVYFDYAWLDENGRGYGFSSTSVENWGLEEHRSAIREFLSQLDPETNRIE